MSMIRKYVKMNQKCGAKLDTWLWKNSTDAEFPGSLTWMMSPLTPVEEQNDYDPFIEVFADVKGAMLKCEECLKRGCAELGFTFRRMNRTVRGTRYKYLIVKG